MKTLLWSELTAPELNELAERDPVVILPVGALEQHGPHLPTGVDSLLAEAVCLAAAEKATAAGTPTVVLPVQWFGYSPHHTSLGGTITLSSASFIAVLTDIALGVASQGFRRLVIVNGHGGNAAAMDVAVIEAGRRLHGECLVAGLTYFTLVSGRQDEFRSTPHGGMGHACEFETSLMLAVHGNLVRTDRLADHIPEAYLPHADSDLFGGKKVRTYREYRDTTPNGVVGVSSAASRDKGNRILDLCAVELATLLGAVREKKIRSEPPERKRRTQNR